MDSLKRGSLPTKIFIEGPSNTERRESPKFESSTSPNNPLFKKPDKSPTKASGNTVKIPLKKDNKVINSFKMNSPNSKTTAKPSQKHIVTKKAINSIVINQGGNAKPYSSSFCQPQYNSNPKEKIKMEKFSEQSSSKKIKTNLKIKINQKKHDSNNIEDYSEYTNLSPTLKFIEIFDKFKTLIQTARKDFTDINILSDFDEMNEDICDIYHSLKNSNHEASNENTNSHDSTSLNLELISGSSERRKSIYKKFFDICQESVKDISLIFNVPVNYTKNVITNMPINIDKVVTNNVTNNNNKTENSRVQVNVNLNVKNIRKISPGRKLNSHKPNKKHKSKKSHVEEIEDDSFDLSESQTFEGVSNKLPHKNYTVQKPRDDWVPCRIFTEGDMIEEESDEDSPVEKKQKSFAKTRSKSQLNLKKSNIMTVAFELDSQKKPTKDNKEFLANIMPDANTIVTESEGESQSSQSEKSSFEEEDLCERKKSDNSEFFKECVLDKINVLRDEPKEPKEIRRNSKCSIF